MRSSQVPAQRSGGTGLAAGTMSGPEVMAQSVAGIAPSAVMATGPALVAGVAGSAVLYSYIAATVVLLLVGWCVSQFARRHAGAGSLFSWIGMGLGPGAGFLGGIALVIGYAAIATSSIAGAALFTGSLLGSAGVDATGVGAQVAMYVVIAAAASWCMVRSIALSTRVGLVLEVVSIGAILAVIAVVLVDQGLSVGAFATTGLGLGDVALGMVLAILGFVGFESASSLGVEARDPLRMVPRAVIGSAGLAGLLYVLSAYTQLVGFGGDPAALAGSASALSELAAGAGVPSLGYVVDLGAALSFFACVTGSLNAAGRTLYEMGRSGLLGGRLGTAHEVHRTPHVALYLLSGACLVVPVALAVSGLSALQVLGYVGTVGTFGYMVAYLLLSLATPAFLRRLRVSWTGATVIGGLAALAMLYVFFRSVYPRPAAPYDMLPYVFLALMIPAAVRYAIVRRRPGAVSNSASVPAETAVL